MTSNNISTAGTQNIIRDTCKNNCRLNTVVNGNVATRHQKHEKDKHRCTKSHYQRAAQLIAAITRMSVEQRTITVG